MGKKTGKKKGGTKSSKAVAAKGEEEEDKTKVEAPDAPEEEEGDEADDDEGAPGAGEQAESEEDDEEEDAGPKRKTKARRLEEALSRGDAEAPEPRGVIYLGHIPKGFFEPQMRKFFSQFGKITRLRLSRSKKNAGSKGYAFVEFEEESVAKIVAETMHKYLMFGKQLVCHLVPKEKQHPALFKGCKRRMINFAPARRRKAREAYNNRPTIELDGEKLPLTTVRQVARRKRSDKKLRDLLTRLEVDFDPAEAEAGDAAGATIDAGAADSAGATVGGSQAAQGKKRRQPAGAADMEKAAPAATAKGGKAKKRKAA